MTGGSLVGLTLLSMAWLFFAGGAVMNFSVLRMARRAKEGEPVPSGIPFIPGVAGSLAAFFTIPALARRHRHALAVALDPAAAVPGCVLSGVVLLSAKET